MIYFNKTSVNDEFTDQLILIPKAYLDKVNKINNSFVRLAKISAYLLLIEAVKDFGLDKMPEIVYNEFGKPRFKNNEFYFNISDTHDDNYIYVGLAVEDKEVGLDLEIIKEHDDKLIRHCTNDLEYAFIKSSKDPNFEFCKLWTKKESYLKFLGTGITKDLKNVLVGVSDNFNLQYIEEDDLIITEYKK